MHPTARFQSCNCNFFLWGGALRVVSPPKCDATGGGGQLCCRTALWMPTTILPPGIHFAFEIKTPKVSLKRWRLCAWRSCPPPNRNTQQAPPIWRILSEAPVAKPRVNPAEWKRYEYRCDSSSSDGCGLVSILRSFFLGVSRFWSIAQQSFRPRTFCQRGDQEPHMYASHVVGPP